MHFFTIQFSIHPLGVREPPFGKYYQKLAHVIQVDAGKYADSSSEHTVVIFC